MVRGPASVLAGAADDKVVLGKVVASWRGIAQHFNEFVDLKAKGLWDVRIALFTVDGTPRDRIYFNVEAKLDKGQFAVEFSIDNSGCWVSSVDPVCLSNREGWKQIGSLIENLDDLQQWLTEEVA
jgi:hypothetical protein